MLTSCATLDGYVSRLQLRSHLNEEERQALLDLPLTTSRRRAGSNFVRRGAPIDCMCVVVEGLVASLRQNDDRSRQIMALHIRGDMADLPSLALAEAVCSLHAITDVSLLHVPLEELHRVAKAHPGVASALLRDTAVDAAIQLEWASNVGRKSSRSRLAHLFCEMAARYERVGRCVGLNFELPMTQEDLANATAMTGVHLNRMLQGLRAEGILEMRNYIVEVLDWARLTTVASFDPAYLRFGRVDAHKSGASEG